MNKGKFYKNYEILVIISTIVTIFPDKRLHGTHGQRHTSLYGVWLNHCRSHLRQRIIHNAIGKKSQYQHDGQKNYRNIFYPVFSLVHSLLSFLPPGGLLSFYSSLVGNTLYQIFFSIQKYQKSGYHINGCHCKGQTDFPGIDFG